MNEISRADALKKISDSAIYGNLGLFIGAGMSKAILNNEWNTIALSWKELLFQCAKSFEVDLENDINLDGLSYPEVATQIGKCISKKFGVNYQTAITRLKEKISEITCWYPEPADRIKYGNLLEAISPKWIITTNYDLILECLLMGKSLSLGPNDQLISPKDLIPIYHLHGIRTTPDSIIISQEDYISLFRPNQYRQHKLSLSFKESTTLIIGYGLGDVNVLTAVDWSKNVYADQNTNYPHDIIQLYYSENPNSTPYRDRNDILIIEFKELEDVLDEIAGSINSETKKSQKRNSKLEELNRIFKDPTEDHVTSFIDDPIFRLNVINALGTHDIHLISGFLELFSKSVEKTWVRAQANGAFYAYEQNIVILIDILEKIPLTKIPPVLIESIAYNLDRVSNYVGPNYGESNIAYRTWRDRKTNIAGSTILEIKNIASSRNYYKIKKLWKY